jgi:type I restriction enzyme M protein
VLSNPPFGKKSSVTIIGEDGKAERSKSLSYERDDFRATTSNKQLNFVQHIASILAPSGRRGRGRAGQRALRGWGGREGPRAVAEGLRRPHAAPPADGHLLRAGREGERALLRPEAAARRAVDDGALGIRPPHEPALHAQEQSAERSDLDDFVACYNPRNRPARASRSVSSGTRTRRSPSRDKLSLDLFWLKDESLDNGDDLPPPDVLAQEIVENLRDALEQFEAVAEGLNGDS